MRKIANNFVGPYQQIRFGQEWFMSQNGAHLISSSFIGLLFFNPVIYLFLMCYGYTKISFKLFGGISGLMFGLEYSNTSIISVIFRQERMDTLPSTSQTRDILITLRGLSSELIFFSSET